VGEARGLTSLRLIWLGTLAFLPLYAGVGVLLGRTWPPRDPAVLEWLVPALVGLGLVLAALSLGIRPALRRFGAEYGPASLSAWLCAEAAVLCGLVLWLESGFVAGFGAFALLNGTLMAILVPTEAGLRRHDGEGRQD